MALVDVTITNNMTETYTLPASWGLDQKVEPGASRVFTVQPERFQQISRENPYFAVIDLKALTDPDRKDLDVVTKQEDTGIAANTATTYAVTATRTPVTPGSINLQVPKDGGGFISLKDVSGEIQEEDGTVVGEITYETGAISVTKGDLTDTPASTTDALLLDYSAKPLSWSVASNAAENINLQEQLRVAK